MKRLQEQSEINARLIGTLTKLTELQDDQIAEIFGPVEARAASVVSPDCNALRVAIDTEGSITATLMQPPNPTNDSMVVPSWETTRQSKSNEIEARGLQTAKRLADACPEAPTIEVITLTASGRRLVIGGFEPGYRRIARSAFRQLDRTSTRRSFGFQAAVRRLTAASTWTQLISDQVAIAADLLALLKQAPLRLTPNDANRRRQWQQSVQQVQQRASTLASQPISIAHDPSLSNAQADDAERQINPTSDVLSALAETLLRLVEDQRHIAIASSLRDIAARIGTAQKSTNPRLAGIGQPLPDELTKHVEMLIDLLVAADHSPDVLQHIRASDIAQTCRAAVWTVTDANRSHEQALLDSTIGTVDGVHVHEVKDPDPFITNLGQRAWLITAPLVNWHDAVQALQALPNEQRASFTSHVLVVAAESGIALPFAVRLTHSGTPPSLPVTPDMLRPFIEQTGLQQPANDGTTTTVNEIIHALIELSSHHALLRQREPAWPAPPTPPVPNLRQIQRSLANQPPNGAHAAELQAALDTLVNQVCLEETGDTTVTLAGELFDAQGRDQSAPSEAPELLEAVAVASAASSLSTAHSASPHSARPPT